MTGLRLFLTAITVVALTSSSAIAQTSASTPAAKTAPATADSAKPSTATADREVDNKAMERGEEGMGKGQEKMG